MLSFDAGLSCRGANSKLEIRQRYIRKWEAFTLLK